VTPLERLAGEYLASLESRGRTPATIRSSTLAVEALTRFARAKGDTAWRGVGPATVADFLQDARKSHRPQVQTFFRWLARADQPVVSVLDWFGRTRWKRPQVDSHAAHPLNHQLERFLDWGLRVRRWSPNTVATYRICTRKLRDFLIHRKFEEWGDVKREDLDDYQRQLLENGASAATNQVVWVILRALMRYLDAVDVRRNDELLMERAPKIPRRIADHLTIEEAAHLLDSIRGEMPLDLRDRAVLEFSYSTACRVSEIAGLTLSMLDLGGGVARVIGKGDKERMVPINSTAVAAIQAYLERGRPQLIVSRREDRVFLDYLGDPMGRMGIGKLIKLRAAAAGAPLSSPATRFEAALTKAT
jgi:integrase/recombinase XerD